jgi:hypothetical protein
MLIVNLDLPLQSFRADIGWIVHFVGHVRGVRQLLVTSLKLQTRVEARNENVFAV